MLRRINVVKSVYQILSEIGLIILYPFSSFIINFFPNKEYKSQNKGQDMIIVERWMTVNIRHLYWRHYLQRQGFRVFIINFPIYKSNFEASAMRLSNFMKMHDIKKSIMVGISAGAITSLIYLQEENGWERVEKFISVGAPFKGTWSAIFLLFARSGWELLPNSMLVKQIRNYRIKNIDKILCIASKFDEMVPFGSILPKSNSYKIEVIGHNNLHLSIKSTYKKIVEFAKS